MGVCVNLYVVFLMNSYIVAVNVRSLSIQMLGYVGNVMLRKSKNVSLLQYECCFNGYENSFLVDTVLYCVVLDVFYYCCCFDEKF